jgi:flagellar operon protein
MDPRITNARIGDLLQQQPPTKTPIQPDQGFSDLLQDRLKVSGHAQTRLQSRGIDLDQGAWDRVMSGVDRAAAKGAKESLVIVDNVALVVSIRNRTVITAVDKDHLKDNVFTNIDSALIV